jgi:predicted ATPase/class 3 adenylate cyclase/DNA-binding CsgD family transcriptional regulator
MSGLPSGAVTFWFSDIEGSTRLVKALRDGYAGVLEEHRRLIRAAVAAHGGHEMDTQGDAFFVAFGGAKQAVLCALDVQRALGAHQWPGGAQVRVRIGIHTGHAVPAAGAYTGLAVHRAARISAVARGGQVLVSQATQALVEDEEEELAFTLVDAGERVLKDLDRPVRLFQLVASGLEAPIPMATGLAGRGQAGGRAAPADDGAGPGIGVAGGLHGFPAVLTSFVGRAEQVREVAGLLERHRLVTVTGPGGTGKTRLAAEVARQLAGGYADGAWLVELAPVAHDAEVATVVAAALGAREQPGVPAAGVVARVLARQQLLLVLDNCEHVIGAAAELCAGLLAAADDVRILATSREPLLVTGEARYRLAPLALPDPGDLTDAASAEAVALFADRASSADTRFALTDETTPTVARLVARLDGMPLAIELAAARVEALGVTQLLNRLDDRFALLAGGDRTAPSRQRSLAALVEWSYQLLDEREQKVFCALSVFPGPFTLEAAEAVAGEDASRAVLRLVDCSLLVPPRASEDGRSRYSMLETLRAYGAQLLGQAGNQEGTDAALARWVLQVAEEAAAGLETSTSELQAARWLDAEDATLRQVLAWATECDPAVALRLAIALMWWWFLRGRLTDVYPLLYRLADRADVGSHEWCAAQFGLGWTSLFSADLGAALVHFTAVRDAVRDQGPTKALADCLAGRSAALRNVGRIGEAEDDGREALAVATELDYPTGTAVALAELSIAALYTGDVDAAVQLARQTEQIQADVPGFIARVCSTLLTTVLTDAGYPALAEPVCAAGLDQSRAIGDLWNLAALLRQMAVLDLRAGRTADAAAHLREMLQITSRAGGRDELLNGLDCCGFLCAATGRLAEAVTLWAAFTALSRREGYAEWPTTVRRRQELVRESEQALGAAQACAAEDRGAAMSLTTVSEYALMLTATSPPAAAPALEMLSTRQRDLITLVAQGCTDAQIAARLNVSIRTVRSQLNQIREQTGCQRRADLTRLALSSGLV